MMKSSPRVGKIPEQIEFAPPVDTSPRFPTDQRLRAYGFTIKSRPDRGENLWEFCGEIYTEREALHVAEG